MNLIFLRDGLIDGWREWGSEEREVGILSMLVGCIWDWDGGCFEDLLVVIVREMVVWNRSSIVKGGVKLWIVCIYC